MEQRLSLALTTTEDRTEAREEPARAHKRAPEGFMENYRLSFRCDRRQRMDESAVDAKEAAN